MDIQERYDELDNIVSSIDILVDDISDKNYIGYVKRNKIWSTKRIRRSRRKITRRIWQRRKTNELWIRKE